MTALSANVGNRRDRARGATRPYVVANGAVIYDGALVGINSAGYLVPWADTAGNVFVGVAVEGPITGNTSATVPPSCIVSVEGEELLGVAVASGVQGSVGELVYSATDNSQTDLVLAASTNVEAVGFVTRFVSAGVCDVQLFSTAEYLALNA